jgi:hypothetical protein
MVNKIREDKEKDRFFGLEDRLENHQNMQKTSIA